MTKEMRSFLYIKELENGRFQLVREFHHPIDTKKVFKRVILDEAPDHKVGVYYTCCAVNDDGTRDYRSHISLSGWHGVDGHTKWLSDVLKAGGPILINW